MEWSRHNNTLVDSISVATLDAKFDNRNRTEKDEVTGARSVYLKFLHVLPLLRVL